MTEVEERALLYRVRVLEIHQELIAPLVKRMKELEKKKDGDDDNNS